MKLENENAKKDLLLAYSQGNMTTYPLTIEEMDKYLKTQYPGTMVKRGIKRREIIRNLKIRIITRVPLQVYTLKILQHQKNPPLLAEELHSKRIELYQHYI